MKLYQKLLVIFIALVMLATSIPGGKRGVLASGEVVSLTEIKIALGLTDLSISDDTLEQLLSSSMTENTTLRQIAEMATLKVSYINKVRRDFEEAYDILVKASLRAVYGGSDWESILKAISKAAVDRALDLLASFVLNTALDSISFTKDFLDVINAAWEISDRIKLLEISNWYYELEGGDPTPAKWQDFLDTFPFSEGARQWIAEHEAEVRTTAQETAYARDHEPEITTFAQGVAQLIRQRADTYKAYRDGLYIGAVTASPTTVIVTNEGEYPVLQIVLGNERSLWPDERSNPWPEIGPASSGVLSFVSGVDKINYLEFIVLGAKARIPFQASPVLPLLRVQTTSAFGDYAPRQITFDASRSIASQGVVIHEYGWDFGDRSGDQRGPEPTVAHAYPLPGIYEVTLTVYASAGNAAATKTVKVSNPVSASFAVSPQHGPPSTVFRFDASTSTTLAGDIQVGEVASYKWDFGDGLPQEESGEPSATHQYADAGFRTVALVVTNIYGASASAANTVYVGVEEPALTPGGTAVGADAVWQKGLSGPNIYTTPYSLYDSFVLGADVVWQQGFSDPAIDTTPSLLYDSFVLGADVVWQRGLSDPVIDTTQAIVVETDLGQAVGTDKAVLTPVQVTRAKNPATGETVAIANGLGAYQARAEFDPTGIEIVAVRGAAPFSSPTVDKSVAGQALFGASHAEATGPTEGTVAYLVPRQVGSATISYSLTLTFQSITAVGGTSVSQEAPVVKTYRRGDANNDGVVTIADALLIAQYLARLRPMSDINVVNGGGVRWDDGEDVLNIADALFIAQYKALLRDEYYN